MWSICCHYHIKGTWAKEKGKSITAQLSRMHQTCPYMPRPSVMPISKTVSLCAWLAIINWYKTGCNRPTVFIDFLSLTSYAERKWHSGLINLAYWLYDPYKRALFWEAQTHWVQFTLILRWHRGTIYLVGHHLELFCGSGACWEDGPIKSNKETTRVCWQ